MISIHGGRADEFVIDLTRNDLLLLYNALNEVCNGIDAWEFSTRLGTQREKALMMQAEIARVLDMDRS